MKFKDVVHNPWPEAIKMTALWQRLLLHLGMGKYLLLFLILSFSLSLRGQDVHLVGQVLDKETKSPIPRATIGVNAKNIFFRGNTDGSFDFSDERLENSDTLTISYLGYATQHIVIGKIKKPFLVMMEPHIGLLKEVTIGRPKLEVGSKSKSHALTASFLPDMDAAMFMVGSAGKRGTIHSVGFYISDGHVTSQGDAKAPFRIKIFEVDEEGSPGRELTNDVIVTAATENNEWFDIDLSHYKIKVPKRGFFVSFSLLNIDYYLLGQDYKKNPLLTKSLDIITPRLGITKDEFSKDRFCFFRFNKGKEKAKWIAKQYDNNYMIRASITLNK